MDMFKRYVAFLLVMFSVTVCFAQPKRPHFNPERFEKDLEQFVTSKACLLPNEAAKFFPLYRGMRKKQLVIFQEMKRQHYVDFYDDKACAEAIRNADARDLELKKIQKEYHEKFMKILPASKVFAIIRAEEQFHRQMLKKAFKHDAP